MSKKTPSKGGGGSGKKENLLKGGRSTETQKIKKKGMKKSSRAWLERQLNDPFVKQAKAEGYRGRAVYKLIDMDQEFDLIKKRKNIVDLGAAPGSWCQYISCQFLVGDFTETETVEQIEHIIDGKKLDLVLSDMAPNTIGHSKTDHIRIMAMLDMALDFAIRNLNEGGDFAAKVFQGGAEKDLLNTAKSFFRKVKHFKPQASRKESPEMFLVAQGFKSEKLAGYLAEQEKYNDFL